MAKTLLATNISHTQVSTGLVLPMLHQLAMKYLKYVSYIEQIFKEITILLESNDALYVQHCF